MLTPVRYSLVDVIGRNRSIGGGIAIQAISMSYVASFLTIVPQLNHCEFFTPSQKIASAFALIMIYISGWGWAMGWYSMQYLLNAEIYPLHIRPICPSIVICFHLLNQYGNTRAVANMSLPRSKGGMGPDGMLWFLSC